MSFFACIAVFAPISLCVRAQHKTESASNGVNESTLEVFSNKPNDFSEIVKHQRTSKGITVVDYCLKNTFISIMLIKECFEKLFFVFKYTQSYFTDAKCFEKSMTHYTLQNGMQILIGQTKVNY